MRIINFFTIFIAFFLTIICLYYISFSLNISNVEFFRKKKNYSKERYKYEKVRNNKTLNLGLDLKGGISMMIEISEKDLLKKFSNNSQDPIFLRALENADKEKKKNQNINYFSYFLNFFHREKKIMKSHSSFTDLFSKKFYLNEINSDRSDKETEKIIRNKIESSIDNTSNILRYRINQLGDVQPNIQRIKKTNRILIELSGIKDINRIKNILQRKAELQFFEIVNLKEIFPFFEKINNFYSIKKNNKEKSFIEKLNIKNIELDNIIVGLVKREDKNNVTNFLNSTEFIDLLPYNLKNIKFLWGYKEYIKDKNKYAQLFAVKNNESEDYSIKENMIVNAYKSFGPFNEIFVNIQMDREGAKNWSLFTEKNLEKGIAIVLDHLVYTAPIVKSVIKNGISQISGNFSLQESNDLINILNGGKLPTSIKIIQSEMIGPSLGKDTIKKGMISFIISIFFIFICMFYYYSIPGIYANISLIFNLIFIFGILISINSVLTFSGIAGIILTLAMSMDACILIYEKIKEDLKNGFSIRQAIHNSYQFKGSLSSIIDSQVTTLLCGLILFFFGIGPIKSFSISLIIGIFTSFFSSVCLCKSFLENHLNYKKIFFRVSNYKKKFFFQWDFLSKRKFFYTISMVSILFSLTSIYYQGLNFGIDFVGGCSYVIRFDREVSPNEISSILSKKFSEKEKSILSIKVFSFGDKNQLKIITKSRIENEDRKVDQEILKKIFFSLKPYFFTSIDFRHFQNNEKNKSIGLLFYEKVDPIISDKIIKNSFFSIILSLLGIFIYLLIRFKKWEFSFSAIISLLHDTIIIFGLFSFFHKRFPLFFEVNQTFIAAILTIIGYSINDTVVLYDKIRNYQYNMGSSFSMKEIINNGINNSLTRTMKTSFITILVITIIFLFGGQTLHSFMLALFFGVMIGTYSSIFIASSIIYDFSKK
ncbi:protein translocase subunit SecD [Blattabacterium cuenoti]|uniref:protein translocase subunit SecD n=1 Tax=Blattabacterium cuenoti TaxID=1653831 RepID=UPI00163CC1E7|nr:protein translocase subunit SecD [Blattabacterium cuenoti]